VISWQIKQLSYSFIIYNILVYIFNISYLINTTLKNLILKYIGMTYINILKRKCHVGINVVFLEVILKLCDVWFMKNIFIAPWTCLYHFDLHIIIRWPENVKRVNKICIHCGHFIHCKYSERATFMLSTKYINSNSKFYCH
jgi:hypothetical protein